MKTAEQLRIALREFQKQYPSVTSGDLQTFTLGWQTAIESLSGTDFILASIALPEVEKVGEKVLLFRRSTYSQKAQEYSIYATIMVKHCNPDETWWMPLPDSPEKIT